jgi:hypothetical protein
MRMSRSCEGSSPRPSPNPPPLVVRMRIALCCEGCGRTLGPDRYWRDPITGRLCDDRAWCPACFARLRARVKVVPAAAWWGSEHEYEGGEVALGNFLREAA